MNFKTVSFTIGVLALVFFIDSNVNAQSADRIGETWKGPDLALIRGILKEGKKDAPSNGTAKPRPEVLKFSPAGDSGVAKSLAEAFGRDDGEKAALAEAFGQIKQGYEVEVAKKGKSNDLAAALTFFISVNVTAFHQAELPSDDVGNEIYQSLQGAMSGVPAFAQMSNAEKQQMHDWLVLMAGFVLTGYGDAKQTGDKDGLKNFAELADYSVRLVLGVELGKMSFAGDKLSIEGDNTAQPMAGSTENKIVGVWSKSASSPMGIAGGQNLVTYAGYYKGQYTFKPNGTYSFKAERWYGYMRSKEFYTTEESGTYTVSGDTLTVIPEASKTTLRNPEGVVQKTQNNQLERVAYKWRFHHFEGLNETQLVLQAVRETTRDGGFSGNSDFPNSFLYSSRQNLEWRY